MLYIWHIDCNIMKKILSLIKKEFEDSNAYKFVEFVDKKWKNFMKDWLQIIDAATEIV
jgi:hypothetical protein